MRSRWEISGEPLLTWKWRRYHERLIIRESYCCDNFSIRNGALLIKCEIPVQYFHGSACLLRTWAHKMIFCILYRINLYNEQSNRTTNVKAWTKRSLQLSIVIKFVQHYKDIEWYSIDGDLTETSYNEFNCGNYFITALACWSCTFNYWCLSFAVYSESRKYASLFCGHYLGDESSIAHHSMSGSRRLAFYSTLIALERNLPKEGVPWQPIIQHRSTDVCSAVGGNSGSRLWNKTWTSLLKLRLH